MAKLTTDELNKNRYNIVIDALVNGLKLPYRHDWTIFMKDDTLYQAYFKKEDQKYLFHKSDITLNKFLEFIRRLPLERIKEIFGDGNLLKLQKRLEEKNEDEGQS